MPTSSRFSASEVSRSLDKRLGYHHPRAGNGTQTLTIPLREETAGRLANPVLGLT